LIDFFFFISLGSQDKDEATQGHITFCLPLTRSVFTLWTKSFYSSFSVQHSWIRLMETF